MRLLRECKVAKLGRCQNSHVGKLAGSHDGTKLHVQRDYAANILDASQVSCVA